MNSPFRKSSNSIENEFCFVPEDCPGMYDMRSGHAVGKGVEKEHRNEHERRDAATMVLGETAMAEVVKASS